MLVFNPINVCCSILISSFRLTVCLDASSNSNLSKSLCLLFSIITRVLSGCVCGWMMGCALINSSNPSLDPVSKYSLICSCLEDRIELKVSVNFTWHLSSHLECMILQKVLKTCLYCIRRKGGLVFLFLFRIQPCRLYCPFSKCFKYDDWLNWGRL